MFSSFTGRARATVVVAGIALALAAGLAPGASATTPPGAAGASTGIAATSTAPAPPTADTATTPTDDTATSSTSSPAAPPTSSPAAPPTSSPAAPEDGAAATGTPATGDPATSDPATPPTDDPAAPPTSAPATPAPPVVHKGVIIRNGPPDPALVANSTDILTQLAGTVALTSKSVTTVVTVPPGMPAAGGDEVSILFGLGPRQTQHYDPEHGNTFRFNFPVGDGSPRQEQVAISLLDAAFGAHYGFVRTVPVEATYTVTISPLRFTLINDCDFDLAGLIPVTNEPRVIWYDELGRHHVDLLMRAGATKTVEAFGRTLTDVTARQGLRLPSVSFEELDPPFPLSFPDPVAAKTQPLLVPDSQTVHFGSSSPDDEFCNGDFRYATTVNLNTL